MEYVVGIIKPHAVRHRLKIVQLLKDGGFHIAGERIVDINMDEAWYLCKDETGRVPVDTTLVDNKIQSLIGTAMVLLLGHVSALEMIKTVLGPEDPLDERTTDSMSLRGQFGEMAPYNGMTASASQSVATRDIQHFFPRFSEMLRGPLSDIDQERVEIDAYFRDKLLPTLLDAFYDMCVTKPAEPVKYLSEFLLSHNPNHPKILKPGEYKMEEN